MRLSSAARRLSFLVLATALFTADAHSRRRITVRTYETNYRIDTWDDGRDELYRVTYWKFGLKSVYTFDSDGYVRTLTARDTLYTFDLAPARMLMDSANATTGDVETDLTPAIDCTTCYNTWNTLCDVGLVEVCFLDDNNPADFDEDAEDSVRRFCGAVGAACKRTASDVCGNQCFQGPTMPPTPAAPTPQPTPAPTPEEEMAADACNPNPCQNGGSCSLDPAGGRICACASGFGGMDCQTDTSSLAPFVIEIDFIGTWTDARRAVFQAAADRWSEVITHVPCGGSTQSPAGLLTISATLEYIDGAGNVFGFASPTAIWSECQTVSYMGQMTFDLVDIIAVENNGVLETLILHEMGHAIGVGTMWGPGFGECSTCSFDESPTWTCPAAVSTYVDIGGSGADIVQTETIFGANCGHLDETLFGNELMTPLLNNPASLSKMTAATLDDIKYIVDPSAVDAYTLPSVPGASNIRGLQPSMAISDTAIEALIHVADGDGNIVEERPCIKMQF